MLRSLDDTTVALLRERIGVETNSSVKRKSPPAWRLLRSTTGCQGTPRRNRHTSYQRQPGCAEQAGGLERERKGRECSPGRRCGGRKYRPLAHFLFGDETLFFGLSLGSVLVLIAIGLAITFGVMGVINMAHGELMMLGAYTTYAVQTAMPGHIGSQSWWRFLRRF